MRAHRLWTAAILVLIMTIIFLFGWALLAPVKPGPTVWLPIYPSEGQP